MRPLFAAAILSTTLAAVLALPAGAADTAQKTSMKTCAATWKTMSAADKAKTKYTDYMGTCMKAPAAQTAAAPAPSMAMSGKPMMSGSMNSMKMEAGGSAKCKDGTTVTYKKRSGTCSGHGGVANWL